MSAEQILARIRWLDEMLKALQRKPSTKETRHYASLWGCAARSASAAAPECSTCATLVRLYVDGPAAAFLPPAPPVVNDRHFTATYCAEIFVPTRNATRKTPG